MHRSGAAPWSRERRRGDHRGELQLTARRCRSCTRLQHEFGYVDREAVPMVAQALNLSRAEVHGVVSFYHDFRDAPPGRHVLNSAAPRPASRWAPTRCASTRSDKLRIGWGETTRDGAVTLEPVFCLGLCACAPAAMLDGKVYRRARRRAARRADRPGARGMTRPRIFVSRATPARWRSAPTRSSARSSPPSASAASTSRSSAPARAASSGSSR